MMQIGSFSAVEVRRKPAPGAVAVALRCVCLTLLLGSMTACASGPKTPPTGTAEPDRFLFERGTETLNDRKWLTAREYFQRLIDTYPQSRHRADAKLGVADSYLGERSAESFVLAANEFREFLTFYPTHERAHYAQFKLGMTYFYQMRAPERDQSETREAIKELTAFVQRYPQSNLLEEGKQRLREARDRLADYEYRVGYHYFRTRWYPGALDRFKVLLDSDPEYTRRDAVFFYLAESYMKLEQPAAALPYFDRLISEFEQSEYLEAAKRRVTEIKEGDVKDVKKVGVSALPGLVPPPAPLRAAPSSQAQAPSRGRG